MLGSRNYDLTIIFCMLAFIHISMTYIKYISKLFEVKDKASHTRLSKILTVSLDISLEVWTETENVQYKI